MQVSAMRLELYCIGLCIAVLDNDGQLYLEFEQVFTRRLVFTFFLDLSALLAPQLINVFVYVYIRRVSTT